MAVTFDDASTTAFFTGANGMGLSDRTYAQLKKEGIESPQDLLEFEAKGLERIFDNFRKPGTQEQVYLTDQDKKDGKVTIRPTPPYIVPAKSQARLLIARDAVEYYTRIGRVPTPSNMSMATLANFQRAFKALQTLIDGDVPDVPKLPKGMSIMKWIDSFKLHLRSCYGVDGVPLAYVVRKVKLVEPTAPPLLANQPFSEKHGSLIEELIARTSHQHPNFAVDDGVVFDKIESVLRNTPFYASIAPHRKGRTGCGALGSIESQYAGKASIEELVAKETDYLINRKWTGQNNVTLQSHAGKHRSAFNNLVDANESVPVDLPNARTRVTYFLTSLDTKDPEVLASIAAVKKDDPGMREDFEEATAFIIPSCPVAKKQKGRGKLANVSAAQGKGKGTATADMGNKKGPKTGVELRWHSGKEWRALTDDQRKELKEHREAVVTKSKGKRGGKASKESQKKFKTMVASLDAMANTVQALAEGQSSMSTALSGVASKQASGKLVAGVGATKSVIVEESPEAVEVQQATDYAAMVEKAKVSALKLQAIVKGGKGGKSKQG